MRKSNEETKTLQRALPCPTARGNCANKTKTRVDSKYDQAGNIHIQRRIWYNALQDVLFKLYGDLFFLSFMFDV